MQYYTKQQLEGSVKFTPTCLVGNWNEDLEQHNTKLKDFIRKKESGHLKLDEYQRRMSIALQGAELTKVRDDEFVHFGDLFQIAHVDTMAVLSCDVEDEDPRPGEHSYAATATSSLTQPCARNTFLLVKYKPPRNSTFDTYYDDDIVRFGQKVRIVANPAVTDLPPDSQGGPRPLCLFSKGISTTHFAKYSRHQVVGMTHKVGFDTVWEVRAPNPEEWVVTQGVEVRAGETIALVHCSTNQALSLETAPYPNDFGTELEVAAHSVLGKGRRNGLEHTFKGEMRGSLRKPWCSQNYWAFVTGDKIGTLPNPPNSVFEVADILDKLRSDIGKSSGGMNVLAKKLLMMDKEGDGSVLKEEFLIGLRCCGLEISESDWQLLSDFFSAHKAHHINVRAFLSELQGDSTEVEQNE